MNLTCVAAGSPMPHVKWRKGIATDLTPEDQIPIGRNVLMLTNIQESENYTCIASSVMASIETTTLVKVQCKFSHKDQNLKKKSVRQKGQKILSPVIIKSILDICRIKIVLALRLNVVYFGGRFFFCRQY